MLIFNQGSGFSQTLLQKLNRPFIVLAFITLVLIAASFAAVAGLNQTGKPSQQEAMADNKSSATVEQNQLPSPKPQEKEAASVELITITPRGFEPSRITRPAAAGRVMLVVVNKSELPDMTLRLLRENGSVIGQTQLPRNRRKWTIPSGNLPAGRYRIIDADRPNFVCDIEITP